MPQTANSKQTFKLLERILELRHGYGTGKTRKLVIDLDQHKGADFTSVYDYFNDDALIIIFWEQNAFLIAKH